MRNKKILWLVQTAIFIALLLVGQRITQPFGNTLITGSVVNFLLIASTLTSGLFSGLVVALISPFSALLFHVVPLPVYMVPGVAIGNAVIVLVYGLLIKLARDKEPALKTGIWVSSVVLGALAKWGAMYASIKWIIVPIVTANKLPAPPKIIMALTGTPQLITALIGGAISMAVVPALIKAVKR